MTAYRKMMEQITLDDDALREKAAQMQNAFRRQHTQNSRRRIRKIGIGIAFAAAIPMTTAAAAYGIKYLSEYEAYKEAAALPADTLIAQLTDMENSLPEPSAIGGLLPWYTALIEKAGEFSADQLIALIKDDATPDGIDSAFVEMYTANGFDSAVLLALLDDESVSEEIKGRIVSKGDFSAEQLQTIFGKSGGQADIKAMQRLAVHDPDAALHIADTILEKEENGKAITDEEYRSVCRAISGYFEQKKYDPEYDTIRKTYAAILQRIIRNKYSREKNSKGSLVQSSAVYALMRICDEEQFTWLMDYTLNQNLKISVIESNVKLMKRMIADAKSEEDLRVILKAMQIHPVIDVAEALDDAITAGTITRTDALTKQIADIREHGVRLPDKFY